MIFKAIADDQYISCKRGYWYSKKYKGIYYFDPADRNTGNIRQDRATEVEQKYMIDLCKSRKYEEFKTVEDLVVEPKPLKVKKQEGE